MVRLFESILFFFSIDPSENSSSIFDAAVTIKGGGYIFVDSTSLLHLPPKFSVMLTFTTIMGAEFGIALRMNYKFHLI